MTTLSARAHQSGAALIIVVLLLLIMTLLGLASLRATLLEERMAGAMVDRNLAFQAAESALRAGEAFVDSQAVNIVTDVQARTLQSSAGAAQAFDCTATGVVCESNPFLPAPGSGSPVAANGCAFSNTLWRNAPALGGAIGAAGTAQFCIEFTGTSIMANDRLSAEIGEGGATDMVLYNYRVYGRSGDPAAAALRGSGRSVVVLQSTYVISRI